MAQVVEFSSLQAQGPVFGPQYSKKKNKIKIQACSYDLGKILQNINTGNDFFG
jgi:hypothetical protein